MNDPILKNPLVIDYMILQKNIRYYDDSKEQFHTLIENLYDSKKLREVREYLKSYYRREKIYHPRRRLDFDKNRLYLKKNHNRKLL